MLPWGEVDVWVAVPEAVPAEALDALAAPLSADERARAEGFALPTARQRFIVTRVLLRRALSRYADVAPAAWTFERGAHGKPQLARGQAALGPCFNVSHTPGLAVCAIAASEVGIDVQNVSRPPPRQSERYLSELEREALRAAPEGERADRFFASWTLKEAYVKARGLGLSLPLAQIGFRHGSAGAAEPTGNLCDASVARLWLGPDCPDDGRRYWLCTWRVSSEHRVAVALAQPPDAERQVAPAEGSALAWPVVRLLSDAGLPTLGSPLRPTSAARG
jgi:4'-phosphopantetheinyl transferase